MCLFPRSAETRSSRMQGAGEGTGGPDGSPPGHPGGRVSLTLGSSVGPRNVAALNRDGVLDVSDPIFLLLYLYEGGSFPRCARAADPDDDGELQLDLVYLLNHIFRGAKPPDAPYPDCGPDTTEDRLSCHSYPVCEPDEGWSAGLSRRGKSRLLGGGRLQ